MGGCGFESTRGGSTDVSAGILLRKRKHDATAEYELLIKNFSLLSGVIWNSSLFVFLD